MAKDATPRETHRSFTVRVPISLYIGMCELAQADGVFINQKVNQLLKLGMGEHISLDAALRRLLITTMTGEVDVDDAD